MKGDVVRNVQTDSQENEANTEWFSETYGSISNFFQQAYHMYDAFANLEACKAMQILNPAAWFSAIGNVMEFTDVEDRDDVDNKASTLTIDQDAKSVGFELVPETLKENLRALDAKLVHKIWRQRFKNHKVNPERWLADHLDQLAPLSLKLASFVRLMHEDVADEDANPTTFLELLTEIEQRLKTSQKTHTFKDSDGGVSREPEVVISENGKVLAAAGKTDMFEDPYYRNKLLESIWHQKDDMDGLRIRMARGTVGNSPEEATIEGATDEKNTDMVKRGSAISAQTKTVGPWLTMDKELLERIWREASAHLRELPDLDKEAHYTIAMMFQAMKAGGLLDRTGKDLPGVVWHKDVYSQYVAIIYPFCFLPGYNNEITTATIYKEKDPTEAHLGKFTENLSSSTFVQTVPEGSGSGFGEIIAFDNLATRHRAHPPMETKRDDILAAMHRARDWGVPGIKNGQAVRAMIHISLRKETADITTMLSKYAPVSLLKWLKSPLQCLLKLPGIQEWSFRTMGGFAVGESYHPKSDPSAS
jgi:hypothetical protein